MAWLLCELEALDIDKARELIDGYAPADAPYRSVTGPSWFAGDIERRAYWSERAPDVLRWARDHGFGMPLAAFCFGVPDDLDHDLAPSPGEA